MRAWEERQSKEIKSKWQKIIEILIMMIINSMAEERRKRTVSVVFYVNAKHTCICYLGTDGNDREVVCLLI